MAVKKNSILNYEGLENFWEHIVSRLSKKVDKVSGKGLSTNDFTNEDKEKLAIFTDTIGNNKYLTTDQNGEKGWSERFDTTERRVYDVIPQQDFRFSSQELSGSGEIVNTARHYYDDTYFNAENFSKNFTIIIDDLTYPNVPLRKGYFSDAPDRPLFYLGNLRVYDPAAIEQPDYNFLIMGILGDSYGLIITNNEEPTTHTIQVLLEEDYIIPKNLPLGVPKVPVTEEDDGKYMRVLNGEWSVEHVEEPKPDWNECSYGSKNYISNRTHYETAYNFTYSETSLSKYTQTNALFLKNLNIGINSAFIKLIYRADISVDDFKTLVTDLPTDGTKTFAELSSGRYGVAIESPNGGYIVLVLVTGKSAKLNGVYIAIENDGVPIDAHTYFTASFGGTVVTLDEKYIPDTIARTEDLLPTTTEAHKQLVTDGDGNTGWADRLAYEVENRKYAIETEVINSRYDNFVDNIFFTDSADPIFDKTVYVDFDGVTYACRPKKYMTEDSISYQLCYGNMEYIYYNIDGFTDVDNSMPNTEPFGMMVDVLYWKDEVCTIRLWSTDEHTVSIYENTMSIKTIDEKYIPDTIARNSDIMQADWNETDETSLAYIRNKPDKHAHFIMTDSVNGYDYVVKMCDGNLVSYPVPVAIEVATEPDKTTYYVGETLDTTGMVVMATGVDGSVFEITDYSVNSNAFTPDDIAAVISYSILGQTITASVPVTVIDPLQDFTYEINEDGTYTLTGWKKTLNGEASTECVIPDMAKVIL